MFGFVFLVTLKGKGPLYFKYIFVPNTVLFCLRRTLNSWKSEEKKKKKGKMKNFPSKISGFIYVM